MTEQHLFDYLKMTAASAFSAGKPFTRTVKRVLNLSPLQALSGRVVLAKSLICLYVAAQLLIAPTTLAQQAPGVQWQRTDWYPVHPVSGPQTQNQSGEDWWYDHKNSHDLAGNPNGYICAGFSGFRNLALGDETASGGCFQSSLGSPVCEDLETAGNVRGTNLATLGLVDLNGSNIAWFKTYNTGYFYRVMQTSDGGYLAAGITSSTRQPNGAPLFYNPTSGFATDAFNNGAACQLGDNRSHAVLVKTAANGNVQWQYLYGVVPFRNTNGTDNSANAYKSISDPWDIIETPSGDFRIVGNASDLNYTYFCANKTQVVSRAFMIEVGANGYWHWGQFYGQTTAPGNFAAITKYGTGGNLKYVVSGTEMLPSSNSTFNGYTGCTLFQNAYVMQFNNASPPLVMDWKTANFNPNSSASQRTDDIQISANGDILFPIIVNCTNCLYSGYNNGEAKVYRLDGSGNLLSCVYNLGQVTAYDLKLRIQPTADEGFAAVSTKLVNPLPPQSNCYDTRYWNTDAYVAKCNACCNIEWEKTFDVDNLPPATAYPGNLKKQECLYSISQAPDGGFVVSGNNSFNFDDNYLTKLYPATPPISGLYIGDTLQDTGLEPNPDTGPMWVSDDIWVRHVQDSLTTHENPIALQPNYVYVRVHNKGCQPASGTLQVYWAKASSSLAWDSQWVANTTAQPGCTATLFGDRITPSPIPIGPIAPNGYTDIAIQWTPPNPNDYSCFGADQSHFCLLARVETSSVAPFGMTFPETMDLFTNVKSNSRIAWKNVSVVDLYPKLKRRAWSIIRNVTDYPILTKLSFELPRGEDRNSFYQFGAVEVDLGKALIKKWLNGGMIGREIRKIDKTTLRILGPDAWIGNIKLDPHEMHTISLLFRLLTRPPKRGKATFALDLVQTDVPEASTRSRLSNRGGVRFTINTRQKPSTSRAVIR